MFKQYNPFNNNYQSRYYSPTPSYQAPSNNYYRNTTPLRNNMRSFVAPPITMTSFPSYSSFTNPASFTSSMTSPLSNLFRSPIGVPQSNGFVPKIGGLLSGLGGEGLGSRLSGLSFSKILGGIQKTVSTVNQIVPLYHQVKPVINNGRTILRMMRAANNLNSNNFNNTNNFNQNNVNNNSQNNTNNNINNENNENNEVIEVIETKTKISEEINETPKNKPSKPYFA